MDLIFTNADREDQGVLLNYDLDLAFGKSENDFECTLLAEAHCCEPGSLLYVEGTEYGGVIDSIASNSTTKEVVYSGRTWHGILASKVIEPLHESEVQGGSSDESGLPEGYTAVEYIESSGTQYIDTGFKPNHNTRVVMDVSGLTQSTNDQCLFGSRQASGNTDYSLWLLKNSEKFQSSFGNEKIQATSTGITNKRVYDKNKSSVSVNTELVISHTEPTFQTDYNLFLLTCNTAGSTGIFTALKLYTCQIYDNGTLVRNYIPCVDSSNTAGLYDLVEGKFYASETEEAFAHGEVIVVPVPTEFEVDGITIQLLDNLGASYVEGYLVVSGDANDCLRFILNRCALSPFVVGAEEQAGVSIEKFKFDRYTDSYSGLIKMLASADLKMEIVFKNGQVTVGATAKCDYTAQEEFDSDLVEFKARKNYKTVNHLVCLGTGELAERTVVHLFADENGNISEEQTQFGFDEITAVYDFPNAESYEELVGGGEIYLKQLWATDELSVDFDASDDIYDIGDIVGAYDNITGLAVAAEIIKKIVTIKNGQTTISYEVGD